MARQPKYPKLDTKTKKLPLDKPANRTEGLANFVAMAQRALVDGDVRVCESILVDLYNDIGTGRAYECIEPVRATSSPVPEYDPKTDGNYSSWLAAQNID